MSIADQIKAFFAKLLAAIAVLILGVVVRDELIGYALLILAFILFAAHVMKAADERKE